MTLEKTLKTVLGEGDVSKEYENDQATDLAIQAAWSLCASNKSMADKVRDLKILNDALREDGSRGAFEVNTMLDLAKALCAFESQARDMDMLELKKACRFLLLGSEYSEEVPDTRNIVKAAEMVLSVSPSALRKEVSSSTRLVIDDPAKLRLIADALKAYEIPKK
jgi:hypothetical protein